MTLDSEEFQNLLTFLQENYEPFKDGSKKYISLDTANLCNDDLEAIKGLFNNPDQQQVLAFIAEHQILPNELVLAIEHQKRAMAIQDFENMLNYNLVENDWQKWFKENYWVLGTEFVEVIEERAIDTKNISDYLMKAYDGFLDIVEIKRPEGATKFWMEKKDHDNWIPSLDLVKAITQATKYIYEVEREANNVKFLERVGFVKTIKPRCVLIFGRSQSWTKEQCEEYRILNSNYYNLTIMTYDHVLERAKRMLGIVVEIESESRQCDKEREERKHNIAEIFS